MRWVKNESVVTVRVGEIVWRESRMDEVRDGEGQSPGTTRLALTGLGLGWAEVVASAASVGGRGRL